MNRDEDVNRDEKDRGAVARDTPGTRGERAFERTRHTLFGRRQRRGEHAIAFQAVLKTASLPSGPALHALSDEVTPRGIDKPWDAVLAAAGREHCDLEVTLTGEGKDRAAREVLGRLGRSSLHGVTVQVR
jgi:hypothetical protein